jgi:triosephosphate isomerase
MRQDLCSVSVHVGCALSLEHNRRVADRTARDGHIDAARTKFNEIYCDFSGGLREAYDEIFGDVVREYNAKQKRADRRIEDYYKAIKESPQKHLAYESIVQIGSLEKAPPGQAVACLREYAASWQKRNPQLVLVGAYLHLDEATPHLHMDWIPVCECSRGMRYQNGLNRAMEQVMGLKSKGRSQTAQIQWQEREREVLRMICREHGIRTAEIDHTGQARHKETAQFVKAQLQQAREDVVGCVSEMNKARAAEAELRAQVEALETRKNELEKAMLLPDDIKAIKPRHPILSRGDVVLSEEDFDRLVKTAYTCNGLKNDRDTWIGYQKDSAQRVDELQANLRKIERDREVLEQAIYEYQRIQRDTEVFLRQKLTEKQLEELRQYLKRREHDEAEEHTRDYDYER